MKSHRVPLISNVFYGWWIVATGTFAIALLATPVVHGASILFATLERDFQWSKTALSGALSLTRIEGGVFGPLEGYLTDRLGPRRMVFIGMLMVGAGLILFSFINSLELFYTSFFLIAAGVGFSTWIPLMSAANNWFIRRRAMAMSIVFMGYSLGSIIAPVLALSITTMGWRTTTFGLGIIVLILALPISRIIRNRPEDYGMQPDGVVLDKSTKSEDKSSRVNKTSQADFTVRQALHTRSFWLISINHAVSGMASVAVSAHAALLLTDMNELNYGPQLSIQLAAAAIAVFGISGALFQIIGGYIGSRVRLTWAIFVFVTIQGTALMIAAMAQDVYASFLFAILFGIGWGGRGPLVLAIRGEYFGRRSFGTLLGISGIMMNAGMIFGPLFAGFMRDNLGTYRDPFLILGSITILGAFAILFAKRPSLV